MKDLSSQFHVDWKYIQGSTLRDNGRSAGKRGQVAWKVSIWVPSCFVSPQKQKLFDGPSSDVWSMAK